MEVHQGSTRIVFVLFGLAFKFPQFCSWKNFLNGLLANMQETAFGRLHDERMCPVLYSMPGGFLVIMPKAEPLSMKKYKELDLTTWLDRGDYIIPAEHKLSSFGCLNGNVVAIDYGS